MGCNAIEFAVNREGFNGAWDELTVICPFAKIVVQWLEEPCSLVSDHSLEHTFDDVRLPSSALHDKFLLGILVNGRPIVFSNSNAWQQLREILFRPLEQWRLWGSLSTWE